MKIAVVGAGAIGGLVGGYLKLKGHDVSLVARRDAAAKINKEGLRLSGVRGDFKVDIRASERLEQEPDLVILATKTQDTESAIKDNLKSMSRSIVFMTQNGIRADRIAASFIPRKSVVSSIVMFGATSLAPGEVVHNFEGSWIIGSFSPDNSDELKRLERVLSDAFTVSIADEISGMKYLKIFINANNCIPAILGKSMQESFSDIETSKISIAIWSEGLKVIQGAGIKLVSLPDFPLERLHSLVSLPIDEAAKIFSGIMGGLSKEPLYGSILQSIKRKKNSEIDYINGEFVSLARECNTRAPLNQKLVEMVHEVERTQRFFTSEELFDNTRGLIG